jgi:TatD DNase family protein
MQLVDTHVHLNFAVFGGELDSLARRWREAQVVHLVHSCVEPAEFASIKGIAAQIPELSWAVGLHPLDARKWTPTMAGQIFNLAASEPRVVAIGEIGLDFFKAENQRQQREVLLSQLQVASKLNKPVIVHCRDAAGELRSILRDWQSPQANLRGVMHCWSGTPEETQWFLDLGFYISFSGIVTFKNAKSVQESAKIVPEDRLLVETDCPFLAPVPRRGKRNEPAFVYHVAEFVSRLRNVSLESLAETTTENASRLFSLNISKNQDTAGGIVNQLS